MGNFPEAERSQKAPDHQLKHLSVWEGMLTHLWGSGPPANHGLNNYPQMEENWNGGRWSRERPAHRNDSRSATARPGGQKETQNCIEKNWLSTMAELKVRLSVKVKGSVPVTANAPLQLLPPRAAQPVIRGQLLFLMGDSNHYLPSVNGLII